MADLLHNNDFKPNDFYHDGMVDVDGELKDISWLIENQYEAEEEDKFLKDIYENGALNIFYKQRTFTKTVYLMNKFQQIKILRHLLMLLLLLQFMMNIQQQRSQIYYMLLIIAAVLMSQLILA